MEYVVIKRRGEQKEVDYMGQQVKAIIEQLKEDDPIEFLDDVLEIKRTQSYQNGWQTTRYELLCACGGPAVWLDVDGVITVAWWNEELVVRIEDEKAKEKLKMIEEYLDEL